MHGSKSSKTILINYLKYLQLPPFPLSIKKKPTQVHHPGTNPTPVSPRDKTLTPIASFKLLPWKNRAVSAAIFLLSRPCCWFDKGSALLAATPRLISSRCSLISRSAGRALFCCHSSPSGRAEIEHENQMPAARRAPGCPSRNPPDPGPRDNKCCV